MGLLQVWEVAVFPQSRHFRRARQKVTVLVKTGHGTATVSLLQDALGTAVTSQTSFQGVK